MVEAIYFALLALAMALPGLAIYLIELPYNELEPEESAARPPYRQTARYR